MATLPTNRTTSNTPTEHVNDHNTIHGLWNVATTKGDLIVVTGAQAYTRLAVGTDGQVLTADAAQTHGLKWATPSGSSALLAVTAYQPGSDTAYTSTSAFPVDVDTTNVTVTFTAPASGNVLVRLTGAANISSAAQNGYWGLRESTTTVKQALGPGVTNGNAMSVSFYVTGLTPGSSHTYKWAHGVSGGATISLYKGPTYGPLTMEVWSAP